MNPVVDKVELDRDDGDRIEVGRKVYPRKNVAKTLKRSPYKKCKIEAKCLLKKETGEKYQKNDVDFWNTGDYYVDEAHQDKPKKVKAKIRRDDCELDPNKLLKEIENPTLEEDGIDVVDDIKNAKASKMTKSPRKKSEPDESGMSILDDLFFSSYQTEKKKPPPSRNKKTNKSNTSLLSSDSKQTGANLRDSKGFGSAGSSADEAIHLETNTLKDDVFDDLWESSTWKSRKRKAPKKGKTVTVAKITMDSDSDSDDWFGSKHGKKDSVEKGSNSRGQNSVKSVDGSLSLFD